MKKLIIIISLILILLASFFLTYKFLKGDSYNKNFENENLENEELNNENLNNEEDYTIRYKNKAEEILKSLTLEEKVGQLFLARLNEETAFDDINNYHLSGFILFDPNVRNKDKVSLPKLLKSYQEASKLTLFIAIDEEGGIVNRLSNYSAFRESPFLSPRDLYELGGYEKVKEDTIEKINLLKSLGINFNLAPVADIATSEEDYIFERSFSFEEEMVTEYVSLVSKTMKDNNLASALKHFPGYGGNLDTHIGLSIDNRSLEELKSKDLKPFIEGVKNGASSILVSHNIISEIDSEYPASLSPKVNNIIRDYIKFNGVVITDDLVMDAINNYVGSDKSAILAINAGNDLLIASDYQSQIPIVIDAVRNGDISLERIDEAVLRVLSLKYSINLIKRSEGS